MIITIDRILSNAEATLANLFIDDRFQCFVLEDEYREDKVPAETRIPAGKYQIGLREYGFLYERYKKRFPSFQLGMLEILNVPGFTDIMIHCGNTDDDTAGCPLVGQGATTGQEITINLSRMAYESLYQAVIKAALSGELWIQFFDNDRKGE